MCGQCLWWHFVYRYQPRINISFGGKWLSLAQQRAADKTAYHLVDERIFEKRNLFQAEFN